MGKTSEKMADIVVKGMEQIKPKIPKIADEMVFPNYSGTKRKPLQPKELATKEYVDSSGGAPEGTAVLSTGEVITKFLRADGDGTSSWQVPAGSGDVSAAVNLTDETLVQGDGGDKGVKTSTATVAQIEAAVTHYGLTNVHIDWTGATNNFSTTGTIHSNGNITTNGSVDGVDVAGMSAFVTSNTTHREDTSGADHSALVTAVGLNTAKNTNVTTNLSLGVGNATTEIIESSDGTNVTLIEADTDNAGLLGADKWDEIVANTLKATNVTTNLSLGAGTATTEIIESSDGTNVTLIEADTDNAGLLGADKWDEIVVNSAHAADNTQAHSDYLLNSGADIATGPLTITADNSTADQAYVPMILYNTDATPPAASGFPVGTLYIQYTE